MANGLTSLTENRQEYRYLEKIKNTNNVKLDTSAKKWNDLLVKSGPATGQVDTSKLSSDEKEVYDRSVEMESFLWKQVLNSMKQTINKSKLIDGGQTEEIFTDFLYDEYSMMMAKKSGTGIADTLFKQLSGYM
ncbi:MAG: hypothetical protein A2015_06330 [Spirochaetes bacterium GWF1_31_7]|nr:MAG: hypothetical protein A2Y30_08165 [Spirochaetes bacterium GWE1_32_154]OHD51364.1 MAG: hypothetical protein A2Y29_14550 [Spirochaetes bacterium GWE2_31_10]OHD53090.1 MAG: hypothetical protein A2015_06330 [Spirochaetes bacterium GWF1_31_7]OHD79282.1 MAG: hypothetical protein A2355_06030 [Spirochaetes bacterium RIFOXYB1_FULL_32_8]HBD95131.1 hypothetical protein [Spirochaetia bacterium]